MCQDEDELIRQAQDGSSSSFGILTARYREQMLRFLASRGLSPHDAEDAAQESLLRAFSNIGTFQVGRPFASWLFTIASNQASQLHRHRQTLPLGEQDVHDARADQPVAVLSAQDSGQDLWAGAKAILSPRQFEALWLRYAQEQSVRQIVRAMRITSIHVKVLLYRARRKLLASAEFRSRVLDDGSASKPGGAQ